MNSAVEHPGVYLYKRLVQAKLFIDSHFAGKIDLSNIAGEASFSKFHFIRLFKSVYGYTPHQYLTHVRIEKAKELLQRDVSVTETCFAIGFESLTSFSGLFRKQTKMTPAQYQRLFRQRRTELRATPLKFIPNCFIEH